MGNKWTVENILGARFGEVDNKIMAEFNKTILIRSYETEKFAVKAEVNLEGTLDGFDRTLVYCLLNAQTELQMFTSLLLRDKITQEEYNNRKVQIEMDVNAVANRYEQLTGRDSSTFLQKMEERGDQHGE